MSARPLASSDRLGLQRALPPPQSVAQAHSDALRALIGREITAAGGWIPFEHYMTLALYAPGLGYYAAGSRKLGAWADGGDFVTAPELTPLFAQALAAQLAPLLQQSAPEILEFGAGSGALAHDLLAALQARGVTDVRYAIVEVSPDLRARQQQRLAGWPVRWLDALPAVFSGVMLANEVLDVLPVQVFVKTADGVAERGVTLRDGALAYADRPADDRLRAAVEAIEAACGELPPGYASEVCPQAQAWMTSVAACLQRGALIVIDYGFPRREFYHPQRLMGTLMCHYRHHAHADPLWLPGLNDITAHVDFTAAAQAAHEAGLDVLGYTSQAHFLINCGLLERLADAPPAARGAVQRLLSEAEMGELFKVLAVGRGLDAPLAGFARGDRTHTL